MEKQKVPEIKSPSGSEKKSSTSNKEDAVKSHQQSSKKTRVTRGRYNLILFPSYRVVEQHLLIPGFLPEFLETSGDQENLRFLENVATRNRTRDCWVEVGYLPTMPQQLHENCTQNSVKHVKLS